MALRCLKEERWTRKKRSDWMLKCIDIFPVRTHIIVSLIVFGNFVKPLERPTECNGIGRNKNVLWLR